MTLTTTSTNILGCFRANLLLLGQVMLLLSVMVRMVKAQVPTVATVTLKPTNGPRQPTERQGHDRNPYPSPLPTNSPTVFIPAHPKPPSKARPPSPNNRGPTKSPVLPTLRPVVQAQTRPPTLLPTRLPSSSPTMTQTNPPSGLPTTPPTNPPSGLPTTPLTNPPSGLPTTPPTNPPSGLPTTPPTNPPSGLPTTLLTNPPSGLPTTPPTNPPSGLPTTPPTNPPSGLPTTPPTNPPSGLPTMPPTNPPSGLPTTPPTNAPTGLPTTPPTALPSQSPTNPPTSQPTLRPSLSPGPPCSAYVACGEARTISTGDTAGDASCLVGTGNPGFENPCDSGNNWMGNWFKFTPSTSCTAVISIQTTGASNFNPAIYVLEDGSDLGCSSLTCETALAGFVQGSTIMSWQAVSNTPYFILMGLNGGGSSVGSYTLSLTC